jgi:hypothetical protein
MLIINGNRPKMSGAEKSVLAWLQASDLSGIAISGCHIPDRSGRTSQEADLMLITPDTLVCIEVKGILERGVNGVLACGVNSRWSLPGINGDPVHVRNGDTNPLGQVADAMFNLKNVTDRAGLDVFVSGLVLIEPHGGSITLDTGQVPLPTGREVLLGGTASALSGWLHTAARKHPQNWTVERVRILLAALDLADVITSVGLADEGFPNTTPAAALSSDAVVVPLRPNTVLPQSPTGGSTVSRTGAPTADRGDLGRSSEEQISPETAMAIATTAAKPLHDAHGRRVRNTVLLGAAMVLISGGVGVMCSVGTDHVQNEHSTSSQPDPLPVGAVNAPAPQTPAMPHPAPSAPRKGIDFSGGTACFPFQSDC